MPERAAARGWSRRRLLGAGAAAAGAAGAAGLGAGTLMRGATADAATPAETVVPFHGEHQAGIATPAQRHAAFVAFDLRPGVSRDDIVGLLKIWTTDAARLTRGEPALADTEPELAARPARLTVTVGFGPAVFTAAGLERQRPAWLGPLPPFGIDRLEPAWSDGDLLVQVCAEEPTTVAHAVRVLSRGVTSLVTVRWTQRGFRDAEPGRTPRNLMGQVDGTVNLTTDAELDRLVWHDGSVTPWLAGGTSLVLRRIAMNLDTWDEIDPAAREFTVGRRLADGAPLTGADEFDEPDFEAVDSYGIPVIPPSSHIARARHTHDGERFLRRGYNYDDAPGPGRISDSGLLFTAYQRDPHAQFLPVQARLAEFDALNEWTTPIGSAVFALPPGVQEPGGYLGQTLFEA
ncbi:MAG TPA: Dyp-type peroxidase [Nocardia sp.]|uniref:Dyp-type peroxidase n=1 Tax=Nocardia sp. TaxID=1821 RepID=UPI002B4B3925|nr:Dyp-type peroxidase [Nocardia sp.]HLS79220.1 Dyp-type peroxidase [Nocardia sp.]